MNVAHVQRRRRIQDAVERCQHGSGHCCGKGTRKPCRQNVADNLAVGRVIQIAVKLERDDAGHGDDDGHDQQSNARGRQYALLRFLDIGCSHGPLGDGLVRAPVERLDEYHAREQRVPGYG